MKLKFNCHYCKKEYENMFDDTNSHQADGCSSMIYSSGVKNDYKKDYVFTKFVVGCYGSTQHDMMKYKVVQNSEKYLEGVDMCDECITKAVENKDFELVSSCEW